MSKIYHSQIEIIIDEGINNIRNTFRQINGKAGWHQHLGTDRVGNAATAIGILLLNMVGKDFNMKYEAVQSLKKSQLYDKNDKSINGGWNYFSNLNNLPATVPTSWALQALKTEFQNTDVSIKNGVNWLLNNHPGLENDNGWGIIKTDISRTFTTCLVLKTLKILGYDKNPQYQSALNWLKKSQNNDDGWGEKFGFPSTINHTAHAIITLLLCNNKKSTNQTEKGIKWLIKSFESQPYWENLKDGGLLELNEIKFKQGFNEYSHRISYYHFSTPYAIIAFLRAGKINSPILFKGIQYLLNKSKDGYLEHPYLLNQRIHPIWAIYDNILALTELKNNTSNWDDLQFINFKNDKITFHYKRDFSTLHSLLFNFSRNKFVWISISLIPIGLVLKYYNLIDLISKQPVLVIIVIPLLTSIIGSLIAYFLTKKIYK